MIKRLIILLFVAVGIALTNTPVALCQKQVVDSLKKQLESADKAQKIDIYIELSHIHLNFSLVAALNFAEQALELSEELNDKKGKADALNRKGNVYFLLAEYEKSLGFYLESLELREEIGDREGAAGSYSNIALIYSEFNDNDKAIDYTLKSYQTFLELGDRQKMGICLNNLTYLHLETKQYPTALDYGLKTLELYNEIDDPTGVSDALNNLGDIYKETGKYAEALSCHLQSLELNIELDNSLNIANSKFNIAQLFFRMGDYKSGFLYLSEGLPLAVELQSNDLIMDMYALMANYYDVQNDYAKALEYHDLYRQVADTIFNQESNNRIAAMKVKFEAERKSEEILLLKQDQNIRNLQKKRQGEFIRYLILSALLVLTFGMLGLHSYRRKKKASEQLRDQNIKYYYANKELKQSENNLHELNTTKDKLFSIIGHDLINPFQALLGLAQLLHDQIEEITIEDRKKYCHLINLSAHNLHNLLQNLLQWTSVQTGKLQFEPTDFSLYNKANETISLMKTSAEKKGIMLTNEVNKEIFGNADANLFSTILRNLISNAIKFTPSGGLIRVRSSEDDNVIQIEVADSGIGIPEHHLDKLFDLEKTFSTKGTSEEEGSGLGLILCKEFVEKNGGEIWVDSVPGQGSRFFFTVPKKV